MKNPKSIVVSVAFALCMARSVQATDYTVKQAGGAGYTTIGAAYDAALANAAGTHRVLIQDSAAYNEIVNSTVTGTAGVKITIEPEGANTPSVYAIKLDGDIADVTLRRLHIDGSLQAATVDYLLSVQGTPATPSPGYLSGNNVIESCTIDGKGSDANSVFIRVTKNGSTTMRDCTLGTNTATAAGFSPNASSCTNASLFFHGNRFTLVRDSRAALEMGATHTGGVGCRVVVDHNLFVKNRGGLSMRTTLTPYYPALSITNNTFYRCSDNTATSEGALWVEEPSTATTKNLLGASIANNLFRGSSPYANSYYDGINTGVAPTDANLDNNGFYMMKMGGFPGEELAMYVGPNRTLRAYFKSVPELHTSYASASGNVLGASDPFVDAENGDFTLVEDCWATTASDTGGYIGAVPTPTTVTRATGTVILLR